MAIVAEACSQPSAYGTNGFAMVTSSRREKSSSAALGCRG
jgi:hypothetical protein